MQMYAPYQCKVVEPTQDLGMLLFCNCLAL